MDEDGIELRLDEGEGHGLERGPVLRAHLPEGVEVVLLGVLRVAGPAILEQPQLVVAQQGDGPDLAGQVEHLAAVRPAVDQVAQQHHPVILPELQAIDQFGEFEVTPVNIADGDETSVHAARFC